MAEYLSPGVYVEEYDSSPRSIEGAGTSTAGFVGLAEKGETVGAPVLITNAADFTRKFGGHLGEFSHGIYRYLPSSVEQFFANGGTRCYVSRVIPDDAKKAEAASGILSVSAANEGSWGNRMLLNFMTARKKKMHLMKKIEPQVYLAKTTAGFLEGDMVNAGGEYNRIQSIFDNKVTFENDFQEEVVDSKLVPTTFIYLVECDLQIRYNDEVERFTDLNLNPMSPNYMGARLKSSSLIDVRLLPMEELKDPLEAIFGTEPTVITLSRGTDGTMAQVSAQTFIGDDHGPGKRTGIQAFMENSIVSILAVPGITTPEVIVSLVSHCENMANRFAVIDMPEDISNTKELIAYRNIIDSTYAAMYHPWIRSFDRTSKKAAFFPPSGSVMGVYSRTDIARGVHKAPANETVSCSGLKINFTKGEQDILNPVGINLIRDLPGQGIRIWGARTAGSNVAFKYVNIRRLFIYVEESIKVNTNWVVFEPNDSSLWARVRLTVAAFLDNLWRSGMLVGSNPEESYFVEIGTTTMTSDDIMNGRLICNIGIAPSRPAEFVVFRITQHTSEAGGE